MFVSGRAVCSVRSVTVLARGKEPAFRAQVRDWQPARNSRLFAHNCVRDLHSATSRACRLRPDHYDHTFARARRRHISTPPRSRVPMFPIPTAVLQIRGVASSKMPGASYNNTGPPSNVLHLGPVAMLAASPVPVDCADRLPCSAVRGNWSQRLTSWSTLPV